jgi:hypothetical protein
MNSEPSRPQPDEALRACEVLGSAFIGFYIIWSLVSAVLLMPLAGLELLNEHVLHRGRSWEDQYAPRPELLLATAGVASTLIYFYFVPKVEPTLLRGWRRYVLSVAGFAFGIVLFAALVWLDLDLDPYDHWYQGWG